MRNTKLLAIPLVMVLVLACGLSNGIQLVTTQLPEILTSAPTTIGAVETLSAQQSSSNCPSTPTAGGLGISIYPIKSVIQSTGQFTQTDGTVDSKPASTVTLAQAAAALFPDIANGFSAQFIGDPCNLSEIKVNIPRTDQQASVDQGIGLINILLAGVMPGGTQIPFVTWLTQEYASLPVGGQQQTTFGTIQATLQRNQTTMILDIIPVP